MAESTDVSLIIYRLAGETDLDQVYDLYMDKTSNPFLTFDPMDQQAFTEKFQELLKTKTLNVATLNEEIIGSYRLIRKTDRQAHTTYLGGFVVKTSFKGKGIGTRLLKHIKEEGPNNGIKRFELTVDLNNEGAISLYKKVGFEIEGIIRMSYKLSATNKYYDEYLMGLLL